MGCASSTPMVQTAGSDMLKAATHVADDATQAAEDAVQGVKDSVGKTLETAKETVATKVEEVKHDVESTLKEKVQHLDEAKNSLMGKLHLTSDVAAKTQDAAKSAVADATTATEAETKNLTATLKHSTETMVSSSSGAATHETDTVRLARTDTETDSLRTSTPEPEIERALANAKANSGEGDDDNAPTPIPTYSELENLGNELLQQHQQAVNDTNNAATNDPLMMAAAAAADNMTTMTTNTTSTSITSTTDNINTNAMHITPIPIATGTTLASAIAATTANAFMGLTAAAQSPQTTTEPEPHQAPTKSKAARREEKLAADRSKQQKQIQQLLEEKRPGTTEWEKYADMLALFRKFNPHDAFRRGGTLTKFNGHGSHLGAAPIRERPLHAVRGDDETSSDTNSNWGRKSPTQRASARAGGRLHRPSSANQRHPNGTAARRNSNSMSGGRKFDYNPGRSRVSDRGSSSVSSGQNFANLPSSATAYRLSPSFGTQSPTHALESVKSHSEMRSQHSPLGTHTTTSQRLEPLWHQQPEYAEQQQPQQRHFQNAAESKYAKTPQDGSSMPLDAMLPYIDHHHNPLTRESSNTSLSSRNTYRGGHIRSYKSSLDLRMPALLTPRHVHDEHHHHHHQHHQNQNPPVRNTSSFLTTARTSPFSLTKSYTDLYFSSTSNKENEASLQSDLSSIAQQRHVRDKSPYKIRDRCQVCCKKYIKT